MTDFHTLGLMPALADAVGRIGLTQPTPIQSQAIPLALEGHDILGLAQTGTGKTMAFGLPLIHQLLSTEGRAAPRTANALILAPTRELSNQIYTNLHALTEKTRLRVATVVGGQSINRQINVLARGTDILVATPGRLIDLIDRRAVDLSTVRFLVLDEADQMLDLGFIHALRKIAPRLGKPRQTMLFSATMPKLMEDLSRTYLTDPKRVQVSPPGKAADKITQSVHFVSGKAEKAVRLREILSRDLTVRTLVFSRTKHGAEKMMKQLVIDGFNAASIHGNKSQGQRDRAIKGFRDGSVTVLVATDVAARGIDIPDVAHVINFDLPEVPENYVHRIGRTARAGRSGEAIAFCGPDEVDQFRQIQKLMKIAIPVASGTEPTGAAEPKARPGGTGSPRRRGGGGGGGGGGKPAYGRGGGNSSGAPGNAAGKRRRSRKSQAA